MNSEFWLFGLIADVGSGSTPTIFHSDPISLSVDDGKFVVNDSTFEMMNPLLKSLPLASVEQWYTSHSSDRDNIYFYTLVSSDKEKIETAIKASEVVLRLVGLELQQENQVANNA